MSESFLLSVHGNLFLPVFCCRTSIFTFFAVGQSGRGVKDQVWRVRVTVAFESTEKEKGVAYMLAIEIHWEGGSGWICAKFLWKLWCPCFIWEMIPGCRSGEWKPLSRWPTLRATRDWWHHAFLRSLVRSMSELFTLDNKGGSISPWASAPPWSRVAPQALALSYNQAARVWVRVSCTSLSGKPKARKPKAHGRGKARDFQITLVGSGSQA